MTVEWLVAISPRQEQVSMSVLSGIGSIRSIDDALQMVDRIVQEHERHGTICEAEAGVDVDYIIDKICLAWHRRYLSFDDVMRQTADEYIALTGLLPNFEEQFTTAVLPLSVCVPGRPPIRFSGDFDATNFVSILSDATMPLRQLTEKLANDNVTERVLEHALAELLAGVCRAWHLSHTPPDAKGAIDESVIAKVSGAVPFWSNMRTIVSLNLTEPNS